MTTALRTINIFARCNRRELRTLDAQSTRLHFAGGTTITRNGDDGQQVVVVCAGAVALGRNGKSIHTAVAGDIVATFAQATASPSVSPTALHALTDCDLLVIDRRQVTALEFDAPEVASRIREAGWRQDESMTVASKSQHVVLG